MKQKNIFEWLAANVLNGIGGFSIAMGFPMGFTIISRELDTIIFIPLGILLLGISYYYKFVKYAK